MNQYYLISQLPSLDGINDSMPIPISEERFFELCNRFLGGSAIKELNSLSLVPERQSEKSKSNLINSWNEGERKLRLALCRERSAKMKKSFDEGDRLPVELIKTAHTAVEFQNPLEAEGFLNKYRLEFLETLRPMDTFAQDFIYYYALKLKLMLRIRAFEQSSGEAAYKSIYNSIINGEGLEAVQ